MKKIISIVAILLSLFCFAGCSAKSGTGVILDKQDDPLYSLISSTIGIKSIHVELQENPGGNKDKASVIIYVPNYTEIFTQAAKQEDFKSAVAQIIQAKMYSTVEYNEYAKIRYENGQAVFDDEELLKSCVEEELLKAVDAVLEEESTT